MYRGLHIDEYKWIVEDEFWAPLSLRQAVKVLNVLSLLYYRYSGDKRGLFLLLDFKFNESFCKKSIIYVKVF